MVRTRWVGFLALLSIAVFAAWLAFPFGEVLRPFCPQGFWREPLLFGSQYCGYPPVSILTAGIQFAGLVLVSLLCVLALPKQHRFHTVRVLLLVWLGLPLVAGIWSGLSWSSLAEFTVALLFWLSISVIAAVWPNNSFKPNPLRRLAQMCRRSTCNTSRSAGCGSA